MAVTISNNEYEELQRLRNYYIREQNIESIKSTKFLEDDIDEPVRTIVGMFALLGCNPIFSCCGFDYDGQPIHKTHEYGNAYVMLQYNSNTKQVIEQLIKFGVEDTYNRTSKWRTWNVERDKVVFVALSFDWADKQMDYPWTKHNCIHYAEKGVIGLKILREMLFSLSDVFLDTVVLRDTNHRQSENIAYWQYPVLKPWNIDKENILRDVMEELNYE